MDHLDDANTALLKTVIAVVKKPTFSTPPHKELDKGPITSKASPMDEDASPKVADNTQSTEEGTYNLNDINTIAMDDEVVHNRKADVSQLKGTYTRRTCLKKRDDVKNMTLPQTEEADHHDDDCVEIKPFTTNYRRGIKPNVSSFR